MDKNNFSMNVFSPVRRTEDDGSLPKGYAIEEVTRTGMASGYVNVRYDGKLYYIKSIQSRGYLFSVMKEPSRYTIMVQGDIKGALVTELDSQAGMIDMVTIIGHIIDNNTMIATPNISRNMQFAAESSESGDPSTLFFDESAGTERRNYVEDNIDEEATRSAFYAGPGGIGLAGPGKNVVSVNSDGNIGLYHTGQLSQSGDVVVHGQITTEWSLIKYFNTFASAVALPTPQHMPNLPKMLAQGKFISQIAKSAKQIRTVFS